MTPPRLFCPSHRMLNDILGESMWDMQSHLGLPASLLCLVDRIMTVSGCLHLHPRNLAWPREFEVVNEFKVANQMARFWDDRITLVMQGEISLIIQMSKCGRGKSPGCPSIARTNAISSAHPSPHTALLKPPRICFVLLPFKQWWWTRGTHTAAGCLYH